MMRCTAYIATLLLSLTTTVTALAQSAPSGGYLMGAGCSKNGELNTGTWTWRSTPIKVASNVAKVSTGDMNIIDTVFLDKEGNLYGLGYNYADKPLLVASGVKDISYAYDVLAYVKTDGTLIYQDAELDTGVASVTCGEGFCVYVKDDGSLWGYGNNQYGQLGLGVDADGNNAYANTDVPMQIDSDVSTVSASGMNTLYVKKDGTLMGMGFDWGSMNTESKNAIYAYVPKIIDTDVASGSAGNYSSMYLKKDGTLYSLAQTEKTVISTGVISYAIGFYAGCVYYVKSDNTLWAYGENEYGMLGNGDTKPVLVAVQIASDVISCEAGFTVSYYITTDGTLMGMGDAEYGQLGIDLVLYRDRPGLVAKDIVDMACGVSHTLYITSDGTLYGVGSNDNGQLGSSDADIFITPVKIATGVKSISAGDNYTLYITNDGTLYGMGENGSGQLGDGTNLDAYAPVKIATDVASIAARARHSLFVTTNGVLYGMGDNTFGELGVGTTDSTNTPVVIADNVKQAACGNSHSLYLTVDGDLYGMGYNSNGQLGSDAYEMTTSPVLIATQVASVAAGYYSTLFITSDGTMMGMGYNGLGELGLDANIVHTPTQIATSVSQVSVGYFHSMYLTTDGTLYTMGMNTDGELGIGLGDDLSSNIDYTSVPQKIATGVTKIAAGGFHSLYLTGDYESLFWPSYTKGAKKDDDLGWIDDTHYPWVWSYRAGSWIYIYADNNPDLETGYWMFYYTKDSSDYGWAYVYPNYGMWCNKSDGTWVWSGFNAELSAVR